jgi:amino acid adenylation domain-containing protein
VTFFAGTFVRHPLALAAAKAVLLHLKEAGPALQRDLNERTARTAERLRDAIAEFGAPYEVTQFSSLIQVGSPADQKLAGLFFYLLRDRGIHIYENRAFVMTTSHTDEDLDRLVKAFRESLAEMHRAKFVIPRTDTKAAVVALAPAPAQAASFPLTEAQKEIWLAAQMGRDATVAYNESLKLEFRGAFDTDLFRTAVRMVVQRHPILLAKISEDGQTQHVDPSREPDVRLIDIPNGCEEDLEVAIEREVCEGFDLRNGPLLRVRIARLSSTHHVVIWTAHHIVCDGWSNGVLIGEVAKIYTALRRKADPELDIPIPFIEYAAAERMDETGAREAVDYWRERFAQLPPPLELPSDRPRPLVRNARAATTSRRIDPALHALLKRAAAQQRTTIVVLLLAGLKTLLYRLTNQTDVVIGLGAAGQAKTGNGCLVGHCVNLLPVRSRIDTGATFQEALLVVKKSVLDAYEHHQSTIGSILQVVKVPRSTARPPLVEVIFNVDRDPGAAAFEGLEFTCERNPKRALHYDLFFNFVDGPRGLYAECDYNTDLFDAATIERWLGHLETLLAGAAANPAERLEALPILTEVERQELLVGWNDTNIDFPPGRTLHECFEEQVTRTPAACAAVFEERRISYSELNGRANQVAHHLRALGVGPDVPVGLFLKRSLDMLAAILGILKAGGAYVPIDPAYPKERLRYILEDSQVPIVVTQESLASELPAFDGRILRIDTDAAQFQMNPRQNPDWLSRPGNLAYVLFTSGSTGRPKGVAIEHHSAVTFVYWAREVFTNQELAGVLFSTSVCFDLSVFEMFVTLSAGGKVIVAPNALHLPNLPAKQEVTLINTVPSAIAELVASNGIPASVKTVNLAGEALADSLVEQIYGGTKVSRVYNLYGPTEATTYSTYTAVPRGRAVTVGRPIANTQAYILDPHQSPAPIGVLGELYLGGEGLARGYYGRPDLTAERFLELPSIGRVYRTGDLCRWLPDRNIHYVGRIDHQVKLRGFRIELGEVETVLSRHERVSRCVAMVRADTPGNQMLAAYVQPNDESAVTAADLRAYMEKHLPDYMIPAAFVFVDKFPLTPNGKIDRKALPAIDNRRVDVAGEDASPQDPMEQMLARLWAKLLKVGRVGVNDNFFELGGHSLLAVRMINEIENLYGKRLPLATLLRAPTVARMAEVLRSENWAPSWQSLVPIRPGGSRPPLFLMHSHGGNVLEYYPLAERLHPDQPVYALQARGLDGRIVRGSSIEEMAAAYLQEIKSLQPQGPYFLGGFCFGGLLALEAAQQLAAQGEEVGLVAMIQTINPPAAVFGPDVNIVQRWWYRASKRVSLEFENLIYRGPGYIKERWRRVRNIGRAKLSVAPSGSTIAILAELEREHDRVYENYRPRPYFGNVLLFRVAKQLRGLVADRLLGWKEVLGGNVELVEAPGHQQSLLVDPNVACVAEKLDAALEGTQREERRGTEVAVG